MTIKITTNQREFNVNLDEAKIQNRAGVGFNIFTLAGLKKRKGEEVIGAEEI